MAPHGLFTWTDATLPDPVAGRGFYSQLFGWSSEDLEDGDGHRTYTAFSKDGKQVAGLWLQTLDAVGAEPRWNSWVSVDDVDAAVEGWTAAGGSVVVPVNDVGTAGRMAFVADPEGAQLGLWDAGEHTGAEVFNEPVSLTWNELHTRDSEAARKFYSAALGWDFEEWDGGYWVIRVPGKGSGGPHKGDPYNGGVQVMGKNRPSEAPAQWVVYFNVADVDATTARLVELGGSVKVRPLTGSQGRMAVVSDSQGATFSIIDPTG